MSPIPYRVFDAAENAAVAVERLADAAATFIESLPGQPAANDSMAEIRRLRIALERIRDYDSYQGGPIAPQPTPVESALRKIASDAIGVWSSS